MTSPPTPPSYAGRAYWGTERVANVRSPSGAKLEFVLNALAPVHGSIVEVGCGTGRFARAIRGNRSDLDVHAVDISPATIASARQIDREGLVAYQVAPAETLPFEDGTLDAVVVIDVLEHVADPRVALVEARRVLKAGGRLVLYVPLEGNPLSVYRPQRRIYPTLTLKAVGHVGYFSESEVNALVRDSGFTVPSFVPTHFPPAQVVGIAGYAADVALSGGLAGSAHSEAETSPSEQSVFAVPSSKPVQVLRAFAGQLLYFSDRLPWPKSLAGAGYFVAEATI